jgi:predicted transcriptional regulator
LLDKLNLAQNPNGSWDDDINTTAIAIVDNCAIEKVHCYCITSGDSVTLRGMNWTAQNYNNGGPYGAPPQTQAFIIMPDFDTDDDGITDFQSEVKNDLLDAQEPDGSWNNDVGDTAIVIYALGMTNDGNNEAIVKGICWLQTQENKEEHSWGSIQYDAKAILALGSAGFDIWEEIAALMLKQRPDGSFGGIEDTSWAVIALSSNPNEETMESMEKAMQWLRSQNFDNNKDLALAALAEQNYENAKLKEEGKGEGNGFIPPPWLLALSLFIVGSLILSYWLFARIDRNEILEGVRKDIYTYIAEHPGEHLANITKKFELSSSSTRYHLSVLEGMDKIVSHKNGKYKRYYINKNGYSKYTNGNGYKHIMSALKNNTARKIVKFLISNPESNQKRVSNALNIHPSTVNWHAKRLKEAEIISKHKKGKEIVYSLNQDVQLRKVIGIIEGSVA